MNPSTDFLIGLNIILTIITMMLIDHKSKK